MALLPLQNFTSFLQTSTAAAQGACAQLVDFTIGSPLRAIFDASTTVSLWMQWLVLQVLSRTRAATSNGPDLDSWCADFSFVRVAATYATGQVTFSRYSAGTNAVVIPGVLAQTSDTTQAYTVLTDPTNITGFWSTGLSAYQITGSASSVNVLVQANNAGIQANVSATAIALLGSAVPGFDTCSNALAFTNAVNAESDVAFRARFSLYINSRSLGTTGAVQAAIAGVSQGVSSNIQPNVPYSGAVTVYVDDGSGATPSTLIAALGVAVNLVRPIGQTIAVQQAPVTLASINVVFTSAAGYNHQTQVAAINLAVAALVSSLGVGVTLAYTQLASVVFLATPGVAGVSTLTINGSPADLPPAFPYGVVRVTAESVA